MGTGVYRGSNKGGRFAFPRSYIKGILVSDQAPNIVRVGNFIHTIIDASVGYGIWYEVYGNFWDWNSNRYTLDFPVIDCWWEYGFNGIHHPQAYATNWTYFGSPPLPYFEIANPFIQTDHVVLPLESAPEDYWIPPYPG